MTALQTIQALGFVVVTALMALVVVLTTCGHIFALVRHQHLRAIKNLMIAYIVFGTLMARLPLNQSVPAPVWIPMLIVSSVYVMIRTIQFGIWTRTTQRDGVREPHDEGAGDAERLMRFLRRSLPNQDR